MEIPKKKLGKLPSLRELQNQARQQAIQAKKDEYAHIALIEEGNRSDENIEAVLDMMDALPHSIIHKLKHASNCKGNWKFKFALQPSFAELATLVSLFNSRFNYDFIELLDTPDWQCGDFAGTAGGELEFFNSLEELPSLKFVVHDGELVAVKRGEG